MEKTYSESLLVRAADCDLFGKMRMDALFSAMQEGGEQHSYRIGAGRQTLLEKHLFFALARIHVSVLHPPRYGQHIRHTTWAGPFNRFFCPRYHVFSLEDGTPLAAAGGLWVMLDTETRKIVSPLQTDIHFPDTSDINAPVELPTKLPAKINTVFSSATRHAAYSDKDVNGHVNNARYITWLCDQLGCEAFHGRHISSLTAGYEKEIRDEDPLSLHLSTGSDAFSFEVLSGTADKHFIAFGEFEVDP